MKKKFKYKYKKYNNIFQKKKPLKKIKITNYLYTHRKLKKSIFLKKPAFYNHNNKNDILYPFFLNLKLINEYFKKK